MAKVRIQTLGCRLNQIESEALAGCFSQKGFSVSMENVSSSSAGDEETLLCIINTCTVTQKAEQKARRLIRLALEKFPLACILVTGCYAELSASEIERIDGRVCAVGGQIKSRIEQVPVLLQGESSDLQNWDSRRFLKVIKEKISEPLRKDLHKAENSFALSTSSFFAHSRASLKIQDGCNSSCSYCAIHFARGKSVSIDSGVALERVLELESKGYDEVVLTSVNICQYKSEYNGQILNFAGLLAFLIENTSKINFRISSIYPQVVDDDFCSVISSPRVRPHFHISVQSGSDAVLQKMNRAYTAQTVLSACRHLRQVKPGCFLACDIITGFPGETEDDFAKTLQLAKDCDFTWVHAFPFSERPGTVACDLPNKVPQAVSGERAKRITAWASENKIAYLEKFVGQELCAILENVRNPTGALKSGFLYHAVTENFIHCEIRSERALSMGKTVRVRLKGIFKEKIVKGGETEVSAEIVDTLQVRGTAAEIII